MKCGTSRMASSLVISSPQEGGNNLEEIEACLSLHFLHGGQCAFLREGKEEEMGEGGGVGSGSARNSALQKL